jgi:hypothetical protein
LGPSKVNKDKAVIMAFGNRTLPQKLMILSAIRLSAFGWYPLALHAT